MPTPDAKITSRDICNQAVVERILADDSVTSIKIFANLESDNYDGGVVASDPGTVGWRIERNTGDAVFNDVVLRGEISGAANTLTIGGTGALESANFAAGSDGWQIGGDGDAEFNDVIVRGDIVSGNWDGDDPPDLSSADSGASAGFALDASEGAAQFEGNVFIGGSVLLDGSGAIRTSNGTTFVELSSSVNDLVGWYVSDSLIAFARYVAAQSDFQLSSDNQISVIGTDVLLTASNEVQIHMASGSSSPDILLNDDVAGGQILLQVSNGDTQVQVREDQVAFVAGTGADPGIGFISDLDTGIFLNGTGIVSITRGGTETARFGSEGIRIGSSEQYGWLDDADTYIVRSAANQVSIFAGGNAELILGTTGFKVPNVYNTTTGSAANVNVVSDGTLARSTSLAEHKRDIRPWTVTDDEWDVLASYEWESKLPIDDGATFRGFVHDYLPERFRAGEHEDLRSIVGAVIQRVKRLEAA